MKYLLPLLFLLPFFATAQSFEVRNESSSKCVKITSNLKGGAIPGKTYLIKAIVNPNNYVRFIYTVRGKVVRAEDQTLGVKGGVKWKARKGELLLIIVNDKPSSIKV